MAERFTFVWLTVAVLLLASCDQTSTATPRQPSASAEPTANAPPVAAGPPVERRLSSTPITPAAASATSKPAPPAADTPDPNAPVTATLRIDKTKARAGEEITVTIDVHIKSGWHIYAIDRPTGPAIATDLKLQLPNSLQPDEKWTTPEPSLDEASSAGEPAFVYAGPVAFQRRLHVARDAAPASIPIRCTLCYQACDRTSCRAPAELKFESSIQIGP
jgi:DsbC/DsbD-like thiol-disulfide interchange protein